MRSIREPAIHADVIVIGAGAAGLSAADALVAAGRRVVVLEAAPALGGLARTIDVCGEPIEAYYHHIFPQDVETRNLIDRFSLSTSLEWRRGPMAIIHEERLYRFDGPFDVLRFSPLSLPQRLRLVLASVAQITRLRGSAIHGEAVGMAGPRWFGSSAYATIWRPLLEAKFGSRAAEVSMAWLASRLRQRAAARRVTGDRLGYLRGGLGQIFARLGEDLQARGARIATSTRVESLTATTTGWVVETSHGGERTAFVAPHVVAAISGLVLQRVVALPEPYLAMIRAVPYRGIVCALVELNRPLSEYYWTNVTDRLGLGCVGIIEHTNLVPAERYGGRSIVYLAHYVDRDDPAWSATDDELIRSVEPTFRVLNPAFDRSWIEDIRVSRDPFAQPIPLVTGPMRDLPIETGLAGLTHISLAHVYPDDRGVSLALGLGRRAADRVLADSAD